MIYFVVIIFLLERMCRPKEGLNGKEYFVEEYNKLGKISVQEWKAAAICIFLLIAVLTVNIHKIKSL